MHSFRKHAFVCASILLTCFTIHAQQTTTLGQLETPNTSAPPGFTGTVTKTNGTQVDNGLPPARPISDVPIQSLITYGSPRVFAHFQGWFCTPANNNACDGHIVIGNNDHDSAHIQAVVDDMRRRGISGVMVDWYGPNSWSDQTAQLVQTYADQICSSAGNPTPCPFSIGFVIDAGASEYGSCNPCTTNFVNDVTYIENTYYNGHNTGFRGNDGRPIVGNFSLDQKNINFATAHSDLSAFNPVFVFNGTSAMNSSGGDGAYEWVYPQTDPNSDNTSGVAAFYSGFPSGKVPIGTGYVGFDDSAASWGKGRKMNRRCGKTWLQIVNDINGPQSVPVQYVQLPTWDDYEEGSELETGIDNCLNSITGSTSGDTLNLNLTFGAQPFDVNPQPSDVGDTSSLSRYDVWYTTQDPSQAANDNAVSLTLAGSSPAANGTSINLANGSFQFPANTQVWLFVNAVGQPFIQNHINSRANAIPYTTGSGSGGNVSLTPASNNFGTVNVGSTSAPATFTLDNGTSATLTSLTTSVSGQFQKQSTTCGSTLSAGSSCTINVVFAPTSSGAQSGTLTASYSGGSQTAQLSGTGNSQAGNDGDGIEDGSWTCTGGCTTPQPNSQSQDGGSSMQFSYTGGAAYSNASYSTTLSNNYSGTSQFKLDFWAYIANPSAPQAFVVKADQVVGGLEYPFLFQCDFKGTQLWRVWNPVGQNWVSSTVGCSQFSASTWNHFVLNFSRTSSNQLLYQNIVINNVTYTLNLTENAISNSNAASMNIGLILDGDSAADTFSYLIDAMTLSQQPTNGATNIDDGGGWTCSGSCQAAAADTSIQKDGSSVRLAYTGGAAYGSGSWSKTLTQDFSSGQNYSLDFWAYIQNPAASQAMVFTADQVVGGKEYPFQVQCDFNGTKLWRVWNPSTSNWDSTSVGCAQFSANTWNHFTVHLSRTSSNQLYYQDIVINGSTYSFNVYENPISNTSSASMKVKVVLDGNSSGTAYSLWLDEVSLTF